MKSTTIKILVGENLIGIARNLTTKEPLSPPYDGHPKLQISRLRLDRLKLKEIFSSEFVHVASQKYPFQIMIEEKDEEKVTYLIKIHNAWLTSMGYAYTTTDYVIVEDNWLEAEYISLDIISCTAS